MLVDMATQIAATRLLTYNAAAGAGGGFPDPTEAAQGKIEPRRVSRRQICLSQAAMA